MENFRFQKSHASLWAIFLYIAATSPAWALEKAIVYLSAKASLPFWQTVGQGVKATAQAHGYQYMELDSALSGETQLKNAQEAISKGVAAIVISPTDSSTAPAVLDLAFKAKVPVAIADIGTNGGYYTSYTKSDNYRGAFEVGKELASALKAKGWHKTPYALVTISLSRKNGQDRTNGFRDAMKAAGFGKEVALKQMQDYSSEETYLLVKEILRSQPRLRGLFIETDQPVEGAMRALKEAKKEREVLLVSFDAMPDIASLLKNGSLIAVGVQQPYQMGKLATESALASIQGKTPDKHIQVPILIAKSKNIDQLLKQAKQPVFGEVNK